MPPIDPEMLMQWLQEFFGEEAVFLFKQTFIQKMQQLAQNRGSLMDMAGGGGGMGGGMAAGGMGGGMMG